jgi:8-oxo-dGTP pyrophosphatase MutT (NUDIX family)
VNFEQLVAQLKINLQNPLPGHASFYHKIKRTIPNSSTTNSQEARKSAVLIVFYPWQNESYFPLILRPPYDGTHGGQMALPGGRMEEFDESYERTALREAEEEIGIKALDVNILGSLTDVYIAPSNYWVKPVIGIMDYKPSFFPDAREVASIHEISLNELRKPDILTHRKIKVRNLLMNTSGFEIQGQWIWGATALILGELLEVLNKEN